MHGLCHVFVAAPRYLTLSPRASVGRLGGRRCSLSTRIVLGDVIPAESARLAHPSTSHGEKPELIHVIVIVIICHTCSAFCVNFICWLSQAKLQS